MLNFSLPKDLELDGKKIEKPRMLKLEGFMICSGCFDASKG